MFSCLREARIFMILGIAPHESRPNRLRTGGTTVLRSASCRHVCHNTRGFLHLARILHKSSVEGGNLQGDKRSGVLQSKAHGLAESDSGAPVQRICERGRQPSGVRLEHGGMSRLPRIMALPLSFREQGPPKGGPCCVRCGPKTADEPPLSSADDGRWGRNGVDVGIPGRGQQTCIHLPVSYQYSSFHVGSIPHRYG